MLDIIVRNAKRLQLLTEDILNFTRLESKSLERFNLIEILQKEERHWKRILNVDNDHDITTAFKVGIENTGKSFAVHTHNDPRKALFRFRTKFL